MEWRRAEPDPRGSSRKHIQVSPEGYVVAHFKVKSKHLFRASLGGQFLHVKPFDSADEAKALCERHYQINGKTEVSP